MGLLEKIWPSFKKPLVTLVGLVIFFFSLYGEDTSTFPAGDHLELRGQYRLGGKWRFHIYHKQNQTSKWLLIGQRTGECLLKAYDPNTDKLLIEMDGALGSIGMNKAKAATRRQMPRRRAALERPLRALPSSAWLSTNASRRRSRRARSRTACRSPSRKPSPSSAST